MSDGNDNVWIIGMLLAIFLVVSVGSVKNRKRVEEIHKSIIKIETVIEDAKIIEDTESTQRFNIMEIE